MKSKTLLFTSLGVLTLGLTSCNSYKGIAEDKVKEISSKLVESFNNLKASDFKTYECHVDGNETMKGYEYQPYTESFIKHDTYDDYEYLNQYDSNNCYRKSYDAQEVKEIGSVRASESTNYHIYKDGYAYELSKNEMTGTKSKSKIDEKEYQAETQESSFIYYKGTMSVIYDFIADPESGIKQLNDKKAEIEKLGNGSYLKYTFSSKGDGSLKFNYEAKILNQETEEEGRKYTILSYLIKQEFVFENNFLAKIYDLSESTIKENGKELYEKEEDTTNIKVNSNFSRDNINLEDYSIEKQ